MNLRKILWLIRRKHTKPSNILYQNMTVGKFAHTYVTRRNKHRNVQKRNMYYQNKRKKKNKQNENLY